MYGEIVTSIPELLTPQEATSRAGASICPYAAAARARQEGREGVPTPADVAHLIKALDSLPPGRVEVQNARPDAE